MSNELVSPLPDSPAALVAIGGSTGALEALLELLTPLPASFPVPIAVVVHIPQDRPNGLTSMLAARCALRVCEADDKMPLRPGAVYFGPPGYHLLVESHLAAALSLDAPVGFSRPSIDVFFESVAGSLGARGMGILLSGTNADGASGLAMIRARGGLTWVQSPGSAAMAVMPEAALALAPHAAADPRWMADTLVGWTVSDE